VLGPGNLTARTEEPKNPEPRTQNRRTQNPRAATNFVLFMDLL